MLSVAELFRIGVPGDWVVDWVQAGWVVQRLIKRTPLGTLFFFILIAYKKVYSFFEEEGLDST
jgi:hypothetical protein